MGVARRDSCGEGGFEVAGGVADHVGVCEVDVQVGCRGVEHSGVWLLPRVRGGWWAEELGVAAFGVEGAEVCRGEEGLGVERGAVERGDGVGGGWVRWVRVGSERW